MNTAVIEMKTQVVAYLVHLSGLLKGLISVYWLFIIYALSFIPFESPGFHVEKWE